MRSNWTREVQKKNGTQQRTFALETQASRKALLVGCADGGQERVRFTHAGNLTRQRHDQHMKKKTLNTKNIWRKDVLMEADVFTENGSKH